MKTFSFAARFGAALIALTLAASLRALPPDEDATPPPKPPHGALSSVTAAQRTTPRPDADRAPAKQSAPIVTSGYASVGFDQLAGFEFKTPAIPSTDGPAPVPTPDVMSQIPDAVRKLDGKKVLVIGFILPTKIENGLATEFLLLNSPLMCCFGVTPATNAWIAVKMPKGIPPVQDIPLPIAGRLHVHDTWEGGWLSSVYQMDGDGVLKPRS